MAITQTSAELLRAAGYTDQRANQHPGHCSCGRGLAAGGGRIARMPGAGSGWILVCRRVECARALISYYGSAMTESGVIAGEEVR